METKKKRLFSNEDELYEYAVKSLARKMRTVAEMKRLMRPRVPEREGEAWIESVIRRLKEQRYLNDTQYASTFTRLRQENKSFGRRRVQMDLMAKGVHADVIERTLEKSYEDVNEEELARRLLQRKRITEPQNDKERARIARMLARAGFSEGLIWKVLKQPWEG
jgi:regulatory protein